MRESVSKLAIEEIYTYIVMFTYEHQRTPSYGEVAKDLCRSKSTVCYAIRVLERAGYLKIENKRIIVNSLKIVFKNEKDAERLGIKCQNTKAV